MAHDFRVVECLPGGAGVAEFVVVETYDSLPQPANQEAKILGSAPERGIASKDCLFLSAKPHRKTPAYQKLGTEYSSMILWGTF